MGRGLDALLGQRATQSSTNELQNLNIELLQPGQYQPRSIMDKEKLVELSESIKAQGIVQPIVVRQITSNKYEIIAGERRWRAAQQAGLEKVPVLIKAIQEQQHIIEIQQNKNDNQSKELSTLETRIKIIETALIQANNGAN